MDPAMVSHQRMLLVFLYTLCCLPQGLFSSCPDKNSYIFISVDTSSDSQLLKKGGHYKCGTGTTLTCIYKNDNVVRGQSIVWWLKSSGTDPLEAHSVSDDFTCSNMYYTPTSSGTYKCQYFGVPDSAFSVTITLTSSLGSGYCVDLNPPSSTVSSTATSGSHITVTATPTPTSRTRNTNHFKGLNPLIYTTIAAILLVSLTLVSIVTCWLRSRKMSSQRTLLPQESPQDYLDYIREGQFTPLTTSEFIASLHERPPTYVESQDIQRSMSSEGGDNNGRPSPPPRPPRPPVRPVRQETAENDETLVPDENNQTLLLEASAPEESGDNENEDTPLI
ncbi:PREDICTED: uncharacterized protein LOC100633378 [Amphimedon queenslandica]|uniref:Ig-like domain-containing protein n=1 Tax=Amphimedon queenslandica TaxID=400682 RepID=A0A1X7VF59_AMPQE|nr:PREDICTED: uncharacterized protein LOC100633378 [Amphimedon queenslandica]|eukprot:XP_003384587.1 PREDICTED: uncharacterized protein LOC100633378 [Amphimedon queenslandica]